MTKEEEINEIVKEIIEASLSHIKNWKEVFNEAVNNLEENFRDVANDPLMKGMLLFTLGKKVGNEELIKAGSEAILKSFNVENIEDLRTKIQNILKEGN